MFLGRNPGKKELNEIKKGSGVQERLGIDIILRQINKLKFLSKKLVDFFVG